MGCEVVLGDVSATAARAVEELFAKREQTFSRFIAGSELNRVNAAAGRPVETSREFAVMLRVALDAAAESDGLVDPTLGAALVGAGYDADLALLRDDGTHAHGGPPGRWGSVRLIGRHVFAPAGVELDLNGVVKGATVDDALALIGGRGWVSAGGDLAARHGVVVSLPQGGTARLERGALATSGTDRRRWTRAGQIQHHLIDPRTGAPASSPWRYVTACAATCVGADVAAKIGFLRGEAGPEWLDARRIPARFVTPEGAVRVNDSWRRSVEREHACT
ncbi:MAG TPA: FAD:protein FMN transferase [Gaiellaceae bacterium]